MSYDIKLKRKKPSDKVAGGYSNTEMRYSDESGASKAIKTEALMAPIGTAPTTITTLPVAVQPGQLLGFFNSTTSPVYLAFDYGGNTAVAALGSALALRPVDYTYLVVPPTATGYVASGSGVAVFDVADSSYLG